MKIDEAQLAARPVVWADPEWHGFSGTCFVFSLFGGAFGLTARHVLGTTVIRYDNIRVPKNLDNGELTLRRPKVYWYNAGAYDHQADICALVFPESESVDDAFDLAGAVIPRAPCVGDKLVTYGFPKSTSLIHYGFDKMVPQNVARSLMRPGWKRLDCFEWKPVEIELTCVLDRNGPPGSLSAASFETMTLDLDGMSGAPLFGKDSSGEATLAGMLVRGDGKAGRAHFIDAEDLAIQAFRVATKQAAVRNRIQSWLREADPNHIFARIAAAHQRMAEFAAQHGHRPRHAGEVSASLRQALKRVIAESASHSHDGSSPASKHPPEQYEYLVEALFGERTPGFPIPSMLDEPGAEERRERNRRKRFRRARGV